MILLFIQKYDLSNGLSTKNHSLSIMEKNRLLKQHQQATVDVAYTGNKEQAAGVIKAPLDYYDMDNISMSSLRLRRPLVLLITMNTY